MRLPTFSRLLLLAALPFMNACGSNDEKTTATSDSSKMTTATPASTASTEPFDMILVKHKVSDFARFQAAFDKDDTARVASGIHAYAIGRGTEDSNTVFVALNVDDMMKAKAFAKDARLKHVMEQAGVTGKPEFHFVHMMFRDTLKNPSVIRSMTNFTVKDWSAWQKAFDSNRQLRLDNGVADRVYGHDMDDNHKVTLVVGINDSTKAVAYWNSDLIKQKRAESGVVGQPERFNYRVVRRY